MDRAERLKGMPWRFSSISNRKGQMMSKKRHTKDVYKRLDEASALIGAAIGALVVAWMDWPKGVAE
jgi:hypothetical protein